MDAKRWSARLLACATATDGTALAEMVIILPMLILLLIGLIEVGRYGDLTIRVSNAARAGVQYGAQNLADAADASGMQTQALNDGQNAIGLSAVATNFCKCADGSASTCLPTDCAASHRIVWVQVVATGTMSSVPTTAILPVNLRTVTVSSTAVMRVAQ